MILEQILAELQKLNANLERTGGLQTAVGTGGQAAAAGLGVAQLTPAATANVTADQLMTLIQPHIANDTIKAELGAAMRGMGINALPEVQPHQIPALYQAFQAVISRLTGGGLGAGPAPAPASII